MDVAAIEVWHCLMHHGHRRYGFIFSDTKIETALMVKDILKLPFRGLEGLLNSVFILMNISLKSLTDTCLNLRSA
ncbi:transposase [Candidatus Enterovibrio escicola]|uniref:transposase n=1 Tax=Candidatus Enterovibrio escicola TaxID=1927127 RepID=UPI001CC2690C|nr:transposase [Candidatus Enterovibrio escacola]